MQLVSRIDPPTAEMRGLSRFGTGCSVPPGLLQSAPEILQSLHELQSFIERLAYHLEAFALSGYGVSEQMRAIAQADMICVMGAFIIRENRYLVFVMVLRPNCLFEKVIVPLLCAFQARGRGQCNIFFSFLCTPMLT